MEQWQPPTKNDSLVEAIEEGKIVKVTEEYAIKENLLILRRPKPQESPKHKKREEEEVHLTFEDFRKPLSWKNNQVLSELAENFQWQISKKRKELGMTRRQLAKSIDESENDIKLIENGILPRNDFVIINKLQSHFNINLRKDKQDFSQSPRSLLKEDPKQKPEKSQDELLGDDIEILEE